MRRCFLHVGTYKTGTTAIQSTLDNHRTALAEHGFLYPRAGIIPNLFAHHNVAWEIAGNSSFQPDYGTIDELIREIGNSKHDVVLSSEHFIQAFPRLTDFQSFLKRLKQCDLQIALVVYFRNPPDYFRSAYFEILRAGCPVPFGPFISAMLERRIVQWGNRSAGRIDVVDALRQLARDKDIEIIAHSYDRSQNSIVADFLSMLRLTPADLGIENEVRANQRPGIGEAFTLFYGNRAGRPPNASEAWLISCLADSLGDDEIHMTTHAKRQLLAKYDDQTQFLKQYGVPGLDDPATKGGVAIAESESRSCLEDVFSATTANFIEKTANRLRHETAGTYAGSLGPMDQN